MPARKSERSIMRRGSPPPPSRPSVHAILGELVLWRPARLERHETRAVRSRARTFSQPACVPRARRATTILRSWPPSTTISISRRTATARERSPRTQRSAAGTSDRRALSRPTASSPRRQSVRARIEPREIRGVEHDARGVGLTEADARAEDRLCLPLTRPEVPAASNRAFRTSTARAVHVVGAASLSFVRSLMPHLR